MKLLESKVKELNLDSIGLHVFLHNEIAYSLYNKIKWVYNLNSKIKQ